MPWKPDIPPPEVVEAAFPRDAFDGAAAALDRVLWLNLPEERQDTLLQRGGEVESLLEEVIAIWNRIGDDRIAAIEARRDNYELTDKLGLTHYVLGDGSHPDLEEIWHRELAAEIQLRVDYKSLFVFGDLLVAAYIPMSEPVWDAPASIRHHDGTTAFIKSVQTLRSATQLPALPQPFGSYMDVLLDLLVSTDRLLGFYRDKFIVHLPPDMLSAGAGGSIAIPLDFHVQHAPRREVAEAELRRLRLAHISRVTRSWFAKQARLKPVFNLYFSSRYHPDLYLDVRFLLHARAIETYDYRRRRKPGNRTLVQRIADVLDQCKTVYKRIIGPTAAERDAFIEAVKVSRNYYTHYNPRLEKKAARGSALLLLLVQLQAIIEMSLLRQLGFPARAINEIFKCVGRFDEIEHFKALVAEETAEGG